MSEPFVIGLVESRAAKRGLPHVHNSVEKVSITVGSVSPTLHGIGLTLRLTTTTTIRDVFDFRHGNHWYSAQ